MVVAIPSEGAAVIRPATDGDVAAVAEIWHAGWADGHAGRVPPELEHQRMTGSWPDEVRARLGHTWVADRGGVPVGFITVVDDEIEQIYVDTTARGSGIATNLLRTAERIIREGGHAGAWLAVVAGNDRARRFYEREGWSDAGAFDYTAHTANGPIPVRAHRYTRPLHPSDP
jgi:putative acetyltransferase